MLHGLLGEHCSGRPSRRGGLKDKKFLSRKWIGGFVVCEGHHSQREQYAEHKGSRAAQKGRLSRKTSGHANKCGLFLLGTEWEVTLSDLCVSKASLTAVWRVHWRRQDQRQGTRYNHCKIQGRDCEGLREEERGKRER